MKLNNAEYNVIKSQIYIYIYIICLSSSLPNQKLDTKNWKPKKKNGNQKMVTKKLEIKKLDTKNGNKKIGYQKIGNQKWIPGDTRWRRTPTMKLHYIKCTKLNQVSIINTILI